MNKKYIVQARVFKAMSDENRLKILELLHEREYNASELLAEMDFGQSTLSHHMRILLSAGIVQARKNGKWTYYSLQKKHTKKWRNGSDSICKNNGMREKTSVMSFLIGRRNVVKK